MASNIILTEDPAQNGQEFLIGGELLRDRAPKESATMEQPSTSCSKPRESSGRAGSSAGMSRVWDPADIRGGRADTRRLRLLWEAPARWWAKAAPDKRQQDPGRITGRDIGDPRAAKQQQNRLNEHSGAPSFHSVSHGEDCFFNLPVPRDFHGPVEVARCSF